MATSAAATSSVSRDSDGSDQSNRPAACSARSTTTEGEPSAPATARATLWVRDAGLGLPVTTAIRMRSPYDAAAATRPAAALLAAAFPALTANGTSLTDVSGSSG